jgi:hypothetical protein
VGRTVLLLAAGFFADLAGAEDAVLVHPLPDDFGQVLAAAVDFGPGVVEQFAAVADTYFLNASYIAIPVSVGIGGLL